MAYFTPEDIQQAKQLDLLTYLQLSGQIRLFTEPYYITQLRAA